jgi:phenylalanyl-tRNA synthetase alpha chain
MDEVTPGLEQLWHVETSAHRLSPLVERLRMGPEQVNVPVRLVLQPVDRMLTDGEANRLCDLVHRALHRGKVLELSAG